MPQSSKSAQTGAERLRSLYHQAGELEFELWNVAQSDPFAELTPSQAQSFNQYLRQARELLPDIPQLYEGVGEVAEESLVSDAHRDLRTTLVPTLHKALPQP